MVLYKNVNGVKIPMTEEEEFDFNSFIAMRQIKDIPVATGRNLIQFIETQFQDKSLVERVGLHQALAAIKITLESSTCNPLGRNDFEEVILLVEPRLEQVQFEQLRDLALYWASTVRFVK